MSNLIDHSVTPDFYTSNGGRGAKEHIQRTGKAPWIHHSHLARGCVWVRSPSTLSRMDFMNFFTNKVPTIREEIDQILSATGMNWLVYNSTIQYSICRALADSEAPAHHCPSSLLGFWCVSEAFRGRAERDRKLEFRIYNCEQWTWTSLV